MSASEKLKALEAALAGEDEDVGIPLPQIVAVVEAAERMPEQRYSNDQPSLTVAWSAKDLRAALTALEEALGGDVT